MPQTINGHKVNEKYWKEATDAAGQTYDPDKDPAKYYATAMKIYKAIYEKHHKGKA